MTYGAGEPERHTYCLDENGRCVHGDDMNCPAMRAKPDCETCHGRGYVSVRESGTHAPVDAPVQHWRCNCDGTLSETARTP